MQTRPWVWRIWLGRKLCGKLVKMKNFNATLFSSDIFILFDLSCYRLGLWCSNLALLTNLTGTIWHKMGKERQKETLGDLLTTKHKDSVISGKIQVPFHSSWNVQFVKMQICNHSAVELRGDMLKSMVSDLCGGLSRPPGKLFVWGVQPWTGLICVRLDCSPIWTVQNASAVRLNTRGLLEILEVHSWATCMCKTKVIIDINSCLLTCITDMMSMLHHRY